MSDKSNWEEMTIRNEERITSTEKQLHSTEKLLRSEVAGLHRSMSEFRTSVEGSIKNAKLTLQLEMLAFFIFTLFAKADFSWENIANAFRSVRGH